MINDGEILETWIETLADSHPQHSAALRIPKPDPFRNPVAYAIRQSLTQIWEQLQGDMNPDVIDASLDNVLRIRAVQDLSPSQAVGFVVQLRSILRKAFPTHDLTLLENRIDQLSLAAFDKYMQCRQQINAVRLHEAERLTHRVAGKVSA